MSECPLTSHDSYCLAHGDACDNVRRSKCHLLYNILKTYANYLSPEQVAEAVRQERERIRAWGNEECIKHATSDTDIYGLLYCKACPDCWQELEEEK